MYSLKTLPAMTDVSGPKFVYVHIVAPHFPYIFTPEGEIQTDPDYLGVNIPEIKKNKEGYLNQVQFLNSQMIPILKTLINESKVPPIIVLQGDHGMEKDNRLQILNAYYLPESIRGGVYPSITPVNSFRLILNGLFDQNLPLLQDESYFVDAKKHYEFKLVPENNATCITETK